MEKFQSPTLHTLYQVLYQLHTMILVLVGYHIRIVIIGMMVMGGIMTVGFLGMMGLMLKAVMTIPIFHILLDGQKLASG